MRLRRGDLAVTALLLDAVYGEPSERFHPTVWMGRCISAFERNALMLKRPLSRRIAGLLLALSLPTFVFVMAWKMLAFAPRGLRWPVEVALVSTTVSMRGLAGAAAAVERELRRGDLVAARARVAEFVGRDTEALSAAEVARAAVESVAENTSDGVVAPMLYGALFGAPGALCYKAINTLDSMVGYREPPYTHLGWAPARLDDLANLAPSRLTALSVSLLSSPRALRAARKFGPLTSSPNAGWVEAAFAGALGLRLGGANCYGGVTRVGPTLGDGRAPGLEDIRRAVGLMRRCCVSLAAAFALVGRALRG